MFEKREATFSGIRLYEIYSLMNSLDVYSFAECIIYFRFMFTRPVNFNKNVFIFQ